MARWRSVGVGVMTLAVVLGSGGTAGAGAGSSNSVADTTSSAVTQIADATDTVSTDTVTQTTDDVTDTVTQTTDDAGNTASGTIGGVSDAANHTTDGETRVHSDNDGRATSGAGEVRGDGANAVDVISSDARTGWRAGGSPSGDGPLLGRRYFAPASLALAAASVRELASLSVLNLGGCGNLHRDGDPITCAEDVPMGDGVLGIVLGTTGIAVLSLLALAAVLAASGTTSFVIGRIREA